MTGDTLDVRLRLVGGTIVRALRHPDAGHGAHPRLRGRRDRLDDVRRASSGPDRATSIPDPTAAGRVRGRRPWAVRPAGDGDRAVRERRRREAVRAAPLDRVAIAACGSRRRGRLRARPRVDRVDGPGERRAARRARPARSSSPSPSRRTSTSRPSSVVDGSGAPVPTGPARAGVRRLEPRGPGARLDPARRRVHGHVADRVGHGRPHHGGRVLVRRRRLARVSRARRAGSRETPTADRRSRSPADGCSTRARGPVRRRRSPACSPSAPRATCGRGSSASPGARGLRRRRRR